MVHFNKELVQQIEIINILSSQTEPLSSKKISEYVGDVTPSTVLNYCKMLKDDIERMYSKKELNLFIDKQGIFLENKGVTLTKIKNYLLSSDLSYQILYAVLTQDKVDTYYFCLTHGTSHSTLRRKIRSINSELSKYGFHIICANNFAIKGDEKKLRNFFSVFLWGIHRKFSDMPNVPNKDFYLNLAKTILNSSDPFSYESELLSFFLFTTNTRVENGHIIKNVQGNDAILENYRCTKPKALSHWNFSDYVYTHFSYSSYYFKDIKDLEYLDSVTLSAPEQKLLDDWVEIFINIFGSISWQSIDFIKKLLRRNLISERVLKISTNLIPFFSSDDFNTIKKDHFFLERKFEVFYTELCNTHPHLNSDYYRYFYFCICLIVNPPEETIPKLKIFCLTDYSYVLNKVFERTLKTKFTNRYLLEFLSAPDDADLIISNLVIPNSLKDKFSDRQFLLLENSFCSQHLNIIEKVMSTIALEDL